MPIPSAPAASKTRKLKDLAVNIQREAEGSGTDSFDNALAAGVVSLPETLQADSADLKALRGRMVRLARQTTR